MFETSKWIWRDQFAGENITCNFRTCFVAENGASAHLAVSAQHFFRAYVNGHEVSGLSSPAPSVFEKRMRYLDYDITPFLQKGENVLAFTVLYLGGEGQNRTRGIPCLIFDCTLSEADGNAQHIVSDSSCRCSEQTGYTQSLPLREARRLTGSTRFDPSMEEKGWKLPGFSDLHWKEAVLSPANLLQPLLMRQEIPEGTKKYQWAPALLAFDSNTAVYDAGEMLTGYVRVICEGKRGTVISLRYGELLEGERKYHGKPAPDRAIVLKPEHSASNDQTETYLDEYVLEGNGREIWEECFTYKAFRYLELSGIKGLKIHKVEVVKTGTALSPSGSFSSDSSLLNELTQACIKTQENALLGMLVDCPHREQAQYLGDSFLQSHTLLYNFTDACQMLYKVLQDFADGQMPDGYFPWVCPCDCTPGGQFSLRMPEYDPLFTDLVWKAYQWTADKTLLKQFYPSAKRMAAYYLSLRNSDGLVPKDQKLAIHISDWPYPTVDESDNVLFIENIYLLRAMRYLDHIAELLKRPEDGVFWKDSYKSLSDAIICQFYDPAEGLFRDTPHSKHHHPGINVLAWTEGLFPNDDVATRDKIAALPFETSVILTFDYLVFLFENGYRQQAFDLIANPKERWGKMITSGSRTIWEGFEDIESHTHAWNCYPLYLLQRYVLGIKVSETESQTIQVAPFFPNPLYHIEGTVQTPFGLLKVSGTRRKQEGEFFLEVPENACVEFEFEKAKKKLNSGSHTIVVSLEL